MAADRLAKIAVGDQSGRALTSATSASDQRPPADADAPSVLALGQRAPLPAALLKLLNILAVFLRQAELDVSIR